MSEQIEKLVCKIGEGVQASSLISSIERSNLFHRNVTLHESSDLSFINGLISSGLRGSALLSGDKLIKNYDQLTSAVRQHLPLVVNSSARLAGETGYSAINNYENVHAVQQTGCFQLVASSEQEEMYLTLIAHRIAELSLIPGIVIADYAPGNSIELPDEDLMRQYLGNPDDQIECPTPSQEIIFGKTRRRVPNWYSFDVPVMLGTHKDDKAISNEAAANQVYFFDHLPELINQAFEEFNLLFGTDLTPIDNGGSSADTAIICLGSEINNLINDLPEESKKQVIRMTQLCPVPLEGLKKVLQGKKAITLLEREYIGGSEKSSFYYKVAEVAQAQNCSIYYAKYPAELDSQTLAKAIQHMDSGQPKKDYHLGVEFTRSSSKYPKHQILLQEIEKKYPAITNASINAEAKGEPAANTVTEVPLAVRMYQDKGPNYTKLSRFYDDTAFFYEKDEQHEIVADPFSAIPVAPSASASFFNQSDKRTLIPVLNLTKIAEEGTENYVLCPELHPIVIGVQQLMQSGIDMAAAKGNTMTKLAPLLKNLSKVASKTIKESEFEFVNDFLPAAFESLATQMKLEGDKLTAAKAEFDLALNEIGDLPVVATDEFFFTPDAIDPGSGELFSLVVDPAVCTNNPMCATLGKGVTMEPQSAERLDHINKQFKLWEQLPDVSGDTITRLFNDKNYSSLAAMMLSRNYYMSMVGASSSEKDTAYHNLLSIVTATTESVVQPKVVRQIKQIDTLIDTLSENVHDKLSKSLPKDNLEGLSKSLKQAQGRKMSIRDVVNQISEHEQGKLIDSVELERKTDLVDALKNLRWTLSEGPTGVGRSRYGMLIAGESSMEWAKQYPANNFTSPVVIHWNGSAPDQTLGLFYGQLRYVLDNIKLMRRAELESRDKYDSSIHDQEIANLGWDNLTDDEKELAPPVLLIAERDDLNEAGWSSLNKILAEKYPLKVFLFDHIASPLKSPGSALAQTNSGMFSTIGLKSAYVFQGGMGNVEHLFEGLQDGLARTYPALFNLYATKSEKHGIAQNIDSSPFASLAMNSRAFPSLRYDPAEKSDFLSGAISLDGNRTKEEDWIEEEIQINEEETLKYRITWADWAYTQQEWRTQFVPIEQDVDYVLLPDYVQLDSKGRKGKLPAIIRLNEKGLQYYAVSDLVIETTEAVLANWNTLQEVAGLLTEFPLKLREEVAKEFASKYDQESDALKKDYEKQLKEQEAAQTEELRRRLKEKLVALSGMAKKKEVV